MMRESHFSIRNRRIDSDISAEQQMRTNREQFLLDLIRVGEIDEGYLERPDVAEYIETFHYGLNNHRDALIHILIGDSHGGYHHHRSVAATDAPDRRIGSRYSVAHPGKSRSTQQVLPNGVYTAKHVHLPCKDAPPEGATRRSADEIQEGGSVHDPNKSNKRGGSGSCLFPEAWRAQDVIEAIREATLYGEPRVDPLHPGSIILECFVAGVAVTSVLRPSSDKSLKIYTAYTRRAQDRTQGDPRI